MINLKLSSSGVPSFIKAFTGVAVASLLAACSGGNGNGNNLFDKVSNDTGSADVNPFQELVDQGATRYLGIYTPMISETEGDVTVHRFSPSDGTKCLRGTEYVMSTRNTGSKDLVIFLQGGGACWPDLCAATETASPGIPKIGLLDSDLPGNPIANMNVAYFPYCDGGVHASDTEYDVDGNGSIEPGTSDQYHHGLHNLSAALDVTVQTFAAPARIVLVGISGGGFGTLFALPMVRTLYPDVSISVVNDSGVSVGRPKDPKFFESLLSYWNISDTFLPASCPNCIAPDGHGTDIFNWALDRDENLRISLLSHTQDATIASFFFGVGGAAWEPELIREMAEVEALHPDRLHSFIANGSEHTFLAGRTALEVDGITVMDWVAAMLDDSTEWTSRID